MRILVADDDLITRKFMHSVLTGAGHEVVSFEDGEALWDEYVRAPAGMVITDWMMPRLSGVEVCARIRQQKLNTYTHVILVTALSPAERTVEAYHAGVDDFLSKPLDSDTLVRRVGVAARGMLALAEGTLRKSLEVTQAALGPEHEGLLDALDGLTAVSREQRCYVRCRAFLRRQHAIAEKAFGPADPRTRKLLGDIEEMTRFEETF